MSLEPGRASTHTDLGFTVGELENRARDLEYMVGKYEEFIDPEKPNESELMELAPVVGFSESYRDVISPGEVLEEMESRISDEYAKLTHFIDEYSEELDLTDVERTVEQIDESRLDSLHGGARRVREYPTDRSDMILRSRMPSHRLANGPVEQNIGTIQEYVHLHGLHAHLLDELEDQPELDIDDESYQQLGVRPTSIHKSKTDHKAALFELVSSIAEGIEDKDSSDSVDIEDRFFDTEREYLENENGWVAGHRI